MNGRSRRGQFTPAEAQDCTPVSTSSAAHKDMANAIRALAMDAVEKAKSGHPGMPMGMADVATVLFTKFLKFDAAAPQWPDRDRFVLSAGHGSMLLYSLLYLSGYPGVSMDDLKGFRQLGSKTAGHPEHGHLPGIETTTGPLGQGIANAVGMALAERLLNARHGDKAVDHFTYAIAGDGCLMEGVSQEAISLAGHLKLGKLIVLWDDNSISIDGATSLAESDDQLARFAASNWATARVDGHDPDAIAKAITAAQKSDKPTLIAFKTIIGYGAPTKQGKASTHGEPLGAEEIKGAREKLGWPSAPFEVPEAVLATWRKAGSRGATTRKSWEKANGDLAASLGEGLSAEAKRAVSAAISALKTEWGATPPKLATRQSSQKVLEAIVPAAPALIGGSADLTGSNGTRTKHHTSVEPGKFAGNYVHYGVREHGMAAAMNGMALHGGVVPYGATHQPVEHLAALRAIPNLNVFRPADAIEVAECWELALAAKDTPSILALTRQALPGLRTGADNGNVSAKGAYVLAEGGLKRDITLIATGSEVSLALEAKALLLEKGVSAAVVSMPSWELFAKQPEAYRREVLGQAPRVAVEAAIGMGWERWIGERGIFVGMHGFGASAPAAKLYEHFGITPQKVAEAALKLTVR
jgi:transketolase